MEASDSLLQKKIKFFCPILDTSTYMQTYLLYQHGKIGNISKDFTISYGTRRHSDYHEHIHASQNGRYEGQTGADEK